MSEIKVNKISQRSGTAITLGNSGTDFQLPSGADIVAQSGSTITIAAGATITNNGTATGFGRTGTVDWDTTKKTTGFTAVNGVGYFCDTSGGAFTMTLPATPSAGNIVALKDYANTFDTNNLTIGRNGSNINGSANNGIISVQGQSLTLIYIDATQGWSAIYGATDADLPVPEFVAATGGTVLTCGDYKTHVFTGPGTFTVSSVGNAGGSNSVEYLVVAGGGGGGTTTSGRGAGGGGAGAGGFRQNYPSPTIAGLPVTATTYPITVGAGGSGSSFPASCGTNAPSGNSSIFSTITSAGGGGGSNSNNTGVTGGSGGGAAGDGGTPRTGAAGNTPPVSPPQGNPGGNTTGNGPNYGSGGGGGAGAAGTNGTAPVGGPGGIGSPIATTFFGPTSPSYGTPGPAPGRYFAGGGGGGIYNAVSYGAGGAGGGGSGGSHPEGDNNKAGTTNTGGGGGGTGGSAPGGANYTGGAGGSGIVVIRYKFQ
jgi:hypothetical protein